MACRIQSKRVTLVHVAKQSKVSVTTASLILSGRSSRLTQFQQNTVDRVRRVADEMGYRANLFASSLLASRSSFFALIMQGSSPERPDAWSDSLCETELLRGATESATLNEVYPVMVAAGLQADETRIRSIERVMAGGVFGTIAHTPDTFLEARLRKHIERGHATVVVFPDATQEWPQNAIKVDHLTSGHIAGRLLLALGVRRILIVRDAHMRACQILRSQGCQTAADADGIEYREIELPAGTNLLPGGANYLQDQIRQFNPDGIFGASMRTSVSSLRACRQLGMKPDREYALVGSDCAFWAHSPDSRITSVDVSWFDAGATALEQLITIAESSENRFDSITLQPRITEGDTCRVPENFKA